MAIATAPLALEAGAAVLDVDAEGAEACTSAFESEELELLAGAASVVVSGWAAAAVSVCATAGCSTTGASAVTSAEASASASAGAAASGETRTAELVVTAARAPAVSVFTPVDSRVPEEEAASSVLGAA